MARFEEHTPIDVLVPYEHNPRIITQAAVDAVARSIAAYDFNEPVLADENGVILAGHNRLRAAKQLGLTEVPVLWLDDIDAQKARAYRIADNKTAEYAQWNRNLLDSELKALLSDGADMNAIGVEQWELDRLTQGVEEIGDNGELPQRLFRKAQRQAEQDDGSEHIEAAPKAAGRPLSPPSIRLLVIIETHEDQTAIRRALGLKPDEMIPAVIRFSDILARRPKK